ncbi:MAG: hypothetical protein IKD74_03590 [Clostridia bacterium]|nr:hypothetical protein [Clostridia bacterium]
MSKRIQGITIEIDGSTTKLNEALKDTNKVISSTNSELKSLNQALKLDPKNTELLAQKQEVLRNNIAATKDKLETLKEAQRQMGDYNKLTDEQKESYRALSTEIAKSENALKNMNAELKNTSKIDLSKLKDTLKKIGEVALDVVKKVGQVASVIGGTLVAAIGAGVKSYAELEKAQKGSQRLFEDSYDIVKKNASSAYKTLGISATKYYDQVNTYAVGLKNALGGDTKAAAELSDAILTAQADIVASTGASEEMVSSAFAAVMRGNYTMIDNLRLGIKGSKEGMEEVIVKVNEWNKAQGNATDYQMGNYADMQKALVDYVKMQRVAGTAQKQLGETISGSVGQMKAALDNFLNGTGSPEELAEVFTNLAKNISKALKDLAPHILSGITTLIETVIPEIVTLLFNLLPQLLNAITDLINKLFDMVSKNTAKIKKTVTELINSFVKFITENLPTIIKLGLIIITALASGIADSLPTLIPAVVDCILEIVDVIIDNLDMIILAAMDIILALAKGLMDALPNLLNRIPDIILNLVTELTKPEMLEKLISASLTLVLALAEGLIKALPELIAIVPKLIKGLFDNIKKVITETDWLSLGKNILKGILNGMLNFGTIVKDTIKKVGNKITSSIKSFFGIKSPSRLMSKEVGENLTAGIAMGFEKGIPETIRDVNQAMASLNNGIQSSLNPVINPTANSNPLIIQIENFNNTRNQDVQELAEELEFYRKNSALAKGGN